MVLINVNDFIKETEGLLHDWEAPDALGIFTRITKNTTVEGDYTMTEMMKERKPRHTCGGRSTVKYKGEIGSNIFKEMLKSASTI